MKIICKQCRREFELTDSEIDFFRRKNLNIPKRCKRCREINRYRKNAENTGNYVSRTDYNDNYSYKNNLKAVILIVLLLVGILTSVIYSLASKYEKNTHVNNSPPIITIVTTTTTTATSATTATKTTKATTATQTALSTQSTSKTTTTTTTTTIASPTYYLNTYRYKFHRTDCDSVHQMNARNRKAFYGTRQEAIDMGYSPCHNCNP